MFTQFARDFDNSQLKNVFAIDKVRRNLEPNPEVHPGEQAPVIISDAVNSDYNNSDYSNTGYRRVLTSMAWGIVTTWMKANAKPLVNARIETIGQLPTFKRLIQKSRCIVPASGYFECHGDRPHRFISHKDFPILGLAGLWDENERLVPGQKRRFTIITQEASDGLTGSAGRMPLILTPEASIQWLGQISSGSELRTLISEGKVRNLQARAMHGSAARQSDFFPEYHVSKAA